MVCFTFSLYANNYKAILVKNRASFVTILCHSMQSAGSEETGSFSVPVNLSCRTIITIIIEKE